MHVDPSIFKAYDIRGIYPEQLNEEAAEAIGRAFATFLEPREVVVGRDMRLSSPAIFEAVVAGLTRQGADVIDLGMVSTDQYYFACATLDRPGMMVTASHNPAAYSGLKMVRDMPYLLSGDAGIQDLRGIVETASYGAAGRRGEVRRIDLGAPFVDKLLGLIDASLLRPLKVVADTAQRHGRPHPRAGVRFTARRADRDVPRTGRPPSESWARPHAGGEPRRPGAEGPGRAGRRRIRLRRRRRPLFSSSTTAASSCRATS